MESLQKLTCLGSGEEEMEASAGSDCSLVAVGSRPGSESGSSAAAALLMDTAGAKRPRLSDGDDVSTDEERPGTPVPRGRGRPTVHGRYVGLGRARAAGREARAQTKMKAEEDLVKEAAVARFRREIRPKTGPLVAGLRVDEQTAARLQDQVFEDLDIITKVATKSSNLKGTFVRDLKDAAASIREAVAVLGSRTVSEETRQLQADNARMQAELDSLRRELDQLRQDMERARKQGSAPSQSDSTKDAPPVSQRPSQDKSGRPGVTPVASSVEEICRVVMVQVGGMLNARLAAIEDRLLPERNLRPPLASDKKRPGPTYAAAASRPASGASRTAEGRVPQASAQSVPSRHAGQAPSASSQRAAESVPNPPRARTGKSWTEKERPSPSSSSPPSKEGEEKRKKKKKKKKKKGKKERQMPSPQQQPRQSQPQPGWTKVGPGGQPDRKGRAQKLRVPQSSAVILTLQPAAVEKGMTYEKVIAVAKSKIDAADIGDRGVRFRKAANGGRLFEFPGAGASSAEKADSLAAKLREALGDEVVRVYRPIKSVDLRVSGLDDSVTSAEVVAAIAKAGDCPVEQVRVGQVGSGYDGLGAVLVHCPVVAAKKVVAEGRLLVGWVSAQVKLLDARPLMCYRCLAPGHVGAQCTEGVDRSGFCYRCGQPGHKARGCAAVPRCVVCAAAGRPSGHRLGSKVCMPPPKGKRRGGSEDGPAPSTQQAEAPRGAEEVPMAMDQ